MNREQYHANRHALYKARQQFQAYISSGNQSYNSYTEARMRADLIEAERKVPRDRFSRKEEDWNTAQFNRHFHIADLVFERRRYKKKGISTKYLTEDLARMMQFYRRLQAGKIPCTVNLPN